METVQAFGGTWTKTKLNMFRGYLDAYLKVLSNQSYTTVFFDAFAGSGYVELEYEVLEGSARIALSAPRLFDRYIFVDNRKENVLSLKEMIHKDFPFLENRTEVIHSDANKAIKELIPVINWKTNRCLMFIDPFATQFDWESFSVIANTQAIDFWYLFPCSAVNRMLKRNGNLPIKWEQCLDRVFGTSDWRESFYHKSPQSSLFGDEIEKDSSIENLSKYLVKRLKETFPGVADNPYVFRNGTNAPLFLFCFAMSNPSVKAQAAALRIANHILKAKDEEPGKTEDL